MDLTALCIIPRKSCWVVFVDALVLSLDGSLPDALAIACRAALADTRVPKVDVIAGEDPEDEPEIELDDDPASAARLELASWPTIVTVSQAGPCYLVDCTAQEELCCSGRIECVVDAKGQLCGSTVSAAHGVRATCLKPSLLALRGSMARRSYWSAGTGSICAARDDRGGESGRAAAHELDRQVPQGRLTRSTTRSHQQATGLVQSMYCVKRASNDYERAIYTRSRQGGPRRSLLSAAASGPPPQAPPSRSPGSSACCPCYQVREPPQSSSGARG